MGHRPERRESGGFNKPPRHVSSILERLDDRGAVVFVIAVDGVPVAPYKTYPTREAAEEAARKSC